MTAPPERRRPRALTAAAALLAAAFGAAVPHPVFAAVMVWPLEHHLASHPGEAATAVIYVANESPQPQEVNLHLIDWEAGDPSPIPRPAGTGTRSLAPYLMGAVPSRLVLAPGERTDLLLTFLRPSGDAGTRWVRVAFETELPASPAPDGTLAEGTVTFRLRRRQQVRIYHTALPAASPDGFVQSIAPLPHDPTHWAVTYANTTDRVFPVRGQWRLSAANGQTVASGSVPRFLAYPGETTVTVDGGLSLSAGTYHLLVVVSPEGEEAGPAWAGELVLRIAGEAKGAGSR